MALNVERVCKTCQREFTVKKIPNSPKYESRGNYCSVSCRNARPRAPTFDVYKATRLWEEGDSCPVVAKKVGSTEMTIRKWLMGLGKYERRYSSGKNRYNWKDAPKRRRKPPRKAILADHESKCDNCGYDGHPEILEVHHKDRNKRNDEPQNLGLLCPNCHAELHFLTSTGKWRHHRSSGGNTTIPHLRITL